MSEHFSIRRRQAVIAVASGMSGLLAHAAPTPKIAYITAKLDLPFWQAIRKGVESEVRKQGLDFVALDSNLNPQTELSHARTLLSSGVAGIVFSPTDSKSAPAVLDLARKAGVPVVIADIGTNGGEYVLVCKIRQLSRCL